MYEETPKTTEGKPQTSGFAIASLVLGIVSLTPIIGFLPGIIAIIMGAVGLSQIKKMGFSGKGMAIAGIILGSLGTIVPILIYGSLFYFGFVADTGPWAALKPELNKQVLNQNAGAIEMYKKQNDKYPEDLESIGKAGYNIMPTDSYMKPFFYEVSEDGQSYELRSLGADGEYGTADDLFPSGKVSMDLEEEEEKESDDTE